MKKVEITNIKGLLKELDSIKLNGKDIKRLTVNRTGYKTLELQTFSKHNIELLLNSKNITGKDEFTVDYTQFYNALKELSSISDNADIEIEQDKIIIHADYMSIELETIEPFVTEINTDFHKTTNDFITIDILNAQDFINILEKQKLFTSTDSYMPIIQGVDFTFKDNNLRLAAIDGFRLMVTDYAINSKPLKWDSLHMTISKDTITALIKILRNNKKEVKKIEFDNKIDNNVLIHLILNDDSVITLLGKQLNGKYFDYTSIMNDNEIKHNFTLNADKFKKSLNIIKKNGIKDSNNNSLLVFNKAENSNNLLLTDYGKKIKSKFDNLNDSNGEQILFALNIDFILESLKYSKDKTVSIGIQNELYPMLITEQKDNYKNRYYLLPVRITDYELEVA